MATYYTSAYYDAAVNTPVAGVIVRRVKHTLSAALAQSTSDTLRVVKLPKGACLIPELCAVFADADPDSGNNATVSFKVTDGTTTKTLISTSNLQAANTRLTASGTDICDLQFFKTGNDDFYAVLTPEANDLDSGAVLFFVVAYTMDADRSDSTS